MTSYNSLASFEYLITHVFLPVELPKKNDSTPERDLQLLRAMCTVAHAHTTYISDSYKFQWQRITKMLDNLQASVQFECMGQDLIISQLKEMSTGDILTFFVRPQNTGLIVRKQEDCVLIELFEVSPSEDAVVKTGGPLIRCYPESAVEVLDDVFVGVELQSKIAGFVSLPHDGGSQHPQSDDSQYVTTPFTTVLLNVGRMVDVPRTTKRIRDDATSKLPHIADSYFWRRSSLWLLIRVAIQTSLDRSLLGRPLYKQLLLFFLCTLAGDENNATLSDDLVHLMACKILRRLRKLGASVPEWLSETVFSTCNRLREILDARKKHSTRPSPFRNPFQDELVRDSESFLPNIDKYIRDVVANREQNHISSPFQPDHRPRGTIEDFLSSNGTFFAEACAADKDLTLCDIEQLIEEGIEDWVANVTNVDKACSQIEILMDGYMSARLADKSITHKMEEISIGLLTGIELFVAVDKLVAREIPMLTNYSPEIPLEILEPLHLRRRTNFHRLSCAYQYLSSRHSRSLPGWSIFSGNFTQNSFPVRYYDQSQHLQDLKGRIEADMVSLPDSSLLAKSVVFELQCPTSIRVWRSSVSRVLYWYHRSHRNSAPSDLQTEKQENLLAHTSELRSYFTRHTGGLNEPFLYVQLHSAYFYSDGVGRIPRLCYAIEYPSCDNRFPVHTLARWQPERYKVLRIDPETSLWFGTRHTSNDALARQANCPPGFSLDEYLVFAQLRAGGSLQWFNILQGLRSRKLNLRRIEVHRLLCRAVLQVGPFDLKTGALVWHEELQDPLFCNALLDELGNLVLDAATGSIDELLMSTISLLVTRVVETSPSETISDQFISLLRRIRRNTLSWIDELSYNLAVAPTDKERSHLLLDVATACRSTFDVGPANLPKLLCSAEDVDAVLSSALLVHILCTSGPSKLSFLDTKFGDLVSSGIFDFHEFSELFLQRNRRISLTVENFLRDTILADPSEYGIDLAIRRVFGHNQLGIQRWELLQYPNERWLRCQPVVLDQHSPIIHVNLLAGELHVDGRLLPGLPLLIRGFPERQQVVFRDQGFLLMPSNIPGMDFTTHVIQPRYRVHFSLRGSDLVVRAQLGHTGNILELVPWEVLVRDLPPALIDGHVHWLDISAKTIEIRPFEHPWESAAEHWRIDFASGQYRVYKGPDTLVNMQSQTWEMVSQCFKGLQLCLDYDEGKRRLDWTLSKNLLITTSSVDSLQSERALRLSISLPQYSLSFFVNVEGELESCDFKDMVYDEDQCIGTLHGLNSLLVLRSKPYIGDVFIPEGLICRRVLIPDGIRYSPYNNQIWIDCTRISLCHTYDVDKELGCLNGDGSMRSMELLANLHELTSCNQWPDQLTCKSGSEAALCILRSGGCRSVMELKKLSFKFADPGQSPQFSTACQEIKRSYYWESRSSGSSVVHDPIEGWVRTEEGTNASLKRAVQRAGHLVATTPTGPSARKDRNCDNMTRFQEHAPFQALLYLLLSSRLAPVLPTRSPPLRGTSKKVSDDIHAPSLEPLFSSFPANATGSNPIFRREYIALLENSAQSAREDSRRVSSVPINTWIGKLREYYTQCRFRYFDALDALRRCLDPTTDPLEQALQQFGRWPPVTGDSLLRCLASASPIASEITPSWKECLTSLALLLLDLQRSRRLLCLALYGLEEELSKELQSEPCDGWDPKIYPDWLLIQIQGNFLIRRAQAETAIEMMFPSSGENTVMQVNMGEGKSSVIIPMVAAALADGKQLVRVVVPKALTVQMFEILVARLGGLVNRPIYYLPFTRSSVHELGASEPHELMPQCMDEGGILLVEPAHVASLKLRSVEAQIPDGKRIGHRLVGLYYNWKRMTVHPSLKLITENTFAGTLLQWLSQCCNSSLANLANGPQVDHSKDANFNDTLLDIPLRWLEFYNWVDTHTRDILDESDEILHARTQFVYTIGHQQPVDGYPDRWTVIQQVLGLLKERAHTLSKNHQNSMEYELGTPGSFPHIRIVTSDDAGRRLISLMIEDVMDGRLKGFNFRNLSPALHDAIRAFISDENVHRLPETVRRVEDYAKNSPNNRLWNVLLLLRGLLASDMLLLALGERRWRIDYGLIPDRTRTLLAVPYRAKDRPAPGTQFGHPDITIILTCLSYYYAGLTKDQLRASFERLLDEDDPSMEYAHWVKEYDLYSLPASLQTLGDVNLRSSEQWDKVTFPLFSRNRVAINFYLSRVVFPKEAHDFQWKLFASSWDLAERRKKLITGGQGKIFILQMPMTFHLVAESYSGVSGTNDGRWLLPMSIAQRDLDHQKGSNAKILSYIVLPENNFYTVAHKYGERWNTSKILQMVTMQQPQIRVLLDVGGQVLDLPNLQVAKEWLKINQDASGAVYFNDSDELMILVRTGAEYPLRSSPLSQQLHRCVVYLDHAHTRGTDLKLPSGSRAAVTLGPKLTKDSLVQGCMRMRKLGQPNGHSVIFFAPPEVDSSIRWVAGKKDPNIPITSVDILYWTIHETWNDIQRRAGSWAQQGMRHKLRLEAWTRFCEGGLMSEKLSDAWLEPERKSLNDLYAPCELKNDPDSLSELDSDIRQRCNTLGVLSLPTARLEEEQEREVNREREREREVMRPPWAQPADHVLHLDVVNLVKTGTLPPLDSGSAFVPVFTTLEKSTAGAHDANVWSPSILATADFCRTIDPESTRGTMDQYLRPVQWILSCRNNDGYVLVLLSPFEVDKLLPDIRTSTHVHLHLYAPRTAERTKPSDDLRLHTVPPLPPDWTPPWDLVDQLNIFAGQLYLRDYQSYLRICDFLGIPKTGIPRPRETHWNRLHIPGSFEEEEIRFSSSPLPFVNALLCIRNRGQPFGHTHMGKILLGQALNEKDFERLPYGGQINTT